MRKYHVTKEYTIWEHVVVEAEDEDAAIEASSVGDRSELARVLVDIQVEEA